MMRCPTGLALAPKVAGFSGTDDVTFAHRLRTLLNMVLMAAAVPACVQPVSQMFSLHPNWQAHCFN